MKREKLFEYLLLCMKYQEQGNAVEESDNVNTGENLR